MAFRAINRRRAAQIATLRSVTNLISKNDNLSDFLNINFDTEGSPPSDSDEALWLKSYDLSK